MPPCSPPRRWEERKTLTMEHEESRSHQKIDQTTVSPWPNERPTPEPICPPCEQPTPRLNHPMSDPLLDQTATFRSVHYVHVATTVTTTKSPTNRSLSLSLNLSLYLYPSLTIGFVILIFFVLIFVSLCLYILVLCNNICLDPRKMWETW